MSMIRQLFDKSKQIERRIEKVIQYDMRSDDLLKQEVSEYVVTDNIASNFVKLLDALDTGMDEGSPEVGVWVSGFYGSGKSSFTKYLGFGLDLDHRVDGRPFQDYLKDRFDDIRVKQRLSTVATKHNPVVVMLDLASEMLAGATMAEISTVLYEKVMQWAGYSRDRKIAYLEFMLEKDGKFDSFKERIKELAKGMSWDDVKNQPLVANRLASILASEFYHELFPDPNAFHALKVDEAIKEDDRVKEMVELVRRRSGRTNVIFILDEVGQYVASRDALILNLDGLAKNLKRIGGGKVWIIATAQQTLTEDDPRARFNSAKLFKLKDRFPVPIDLEASDIREICYRRLLGKSADGEEVLKKRFSDHGQTLRFNTKLEGTRYYNSEVDANTYYQLYPFLPQHFDILLELLGRLSKSSGGIGLRSAIKVIQDVLINPDSVRAGEQVLAQKPVGTLATAVTFYDTLRRDIERSFRHIVSGVDKVVKIFGEESVETQVAKTVAVLQVLENCPVSRENVAALLQARDDAPSMLSEVEKSSEVLLREEAVPLSEVDNNLRFMSEAVSDLENERRKLIPTVAERNRLLNGRLQEIFTPLPRTSLKNTRQVQCGIKIVGRAGTVSISGEKEEIQMVIEFVPTANYDSTRQSRVQESSEPASKQTIYLLAKEDPEIENVVEEILRSQQIYNNNRNKTTEKEVDEYLNGQKQRADRLIREDLDVRLRRALKGGSFVFRGTPQAVSGLAQELEDAARKHLSGVAERVYDKYDQAPLSADSSIAERFLKTEQLDRIETKNDPLSIVQSNGRIDTKQAALRSIHDYLDLRGQVEGRKMLDDFYAAPYGWSKDTLRYLIAALLVAGDIKLRVSGEDVTVRGPIAIENLKSNTSFNRVGVSLRDEGPKPENLSRASDRLLELTGETVLPLEDEVSKAVLKHFPDFQREYAPLRTQLHGLRLPGEDRAERIQDSISEILKGDASDAAVRLGSEEAPLYEDLLWARKVKQAMKNGIEETVGKANRLLKDIPALPDEGPIRELHSNTLDSRNLISEYLQRDNFYDYIPELQSQITAIDQKVTVTVKKLSEEQEAIISKEKDRLERMPEWTRMNQDDQIRIAEKLDGLRITFGSGLRGIQEYLNQSYRFTNTLRRVEEEIRELGKITYEPTTDEGEVNDDGGQVVSFDGFPKEITSLDQLDSLIKQLETLRESVARYSKIVIRW